jgi:hypothetical protein
MHVLHCLRANRPSWHVPELWWQRQPASDSPGASAGQVSSFIRARAQTGWL